MLRNKNAIIYGGGGAVGGAVAKAFASHGARVFLAGRTLSSLRSVAAEIIKADGKAEVGRVDALDKDAVEDHFNTVVKAAGKIDIVFNCIGINDKHGTSLSAMDREDFVQPVINAMNSQFITGTIASRHMAVNGSGTILAITANASRKPYPNIGGFGVACAAIEGFCRQLAFEVGPAGVRVVCLRSAGSPDAPGVSAVFDLHAQQAGVSRAAFDIAFAERTMLRHLPTLREVANAAVLMASDQASAITAAVLNITCGELAD